VLSKLRRLVEGLVIVVPSEACRPCLPLNGVLNGVRGEPICPLLRGLGKDVSDPDDMEVSSPMLAPPADTGDSAVSAGVVGSDPDCA
jgi:hypothetical protein